MEWVTRCCQRRSCQRQVWALRVTGRRAAVRRLAVARSQGGRERSIGHAAWEAVAPITKGAAVAPITKGATCKWRAARTCAREGKCARSGGAGGVVAVVLRWSWRRGAGSRQCGLGWVARFVNVTIWHTFVLQNGLDPRDRPSGGRHRSARTQSACLPEQSRHSPHVTECRDSAWEQTYRAHAATARAHSRVHG